MAEKDGKCHHRKAAENIPPLFQHGSVVFQAHHVGWIVSGFFTLVACIVSFWLINKHLVWYTNKREQRHIVRILFMVPIYALISLASYVFWNTATPLILIRDSYESIVLASFFYLLLLYVSNDYDEQRLVFLRVGLSQQADQEAIWKGEKIKKWCWPMGFIKKKPRDGLYFLQIMKWAILQYSVLRPLTTLAAVILEYAGLYCEISWGPQWGHLYIVVIVSLSVTVAMYCLIQLYIPISTRLKQHKPILKLFSIKAVVFLTFWQASFLSLLSMMGVVKDGKYMTAEQINIGFGALLQTFEMMIFAFMHLKAFSYRPYRPNRPREPEKQAQDTTLTSTEQNPRQNQTPRLRSLGHAMNFYETFREIWQGWLYMYDHIRGREPRYDASARRAAHLEAALGVSRSSGPVNPTDNSKLEKCEARIENKHLSSSYRLASVTRDPSDGFSVGIERELERRGLGSHLSPNQELHDAVVPSRSWWRSIYTRLSQSGQGEENSSLSPVPSRKGSYSRYYPRDKRKARDLLASRQEEYQYDDPPPTGIAHPYKRTYRYELSADRDDLAPLSLYDEHRLRSAYPQPLRHEQNNSDRYSPVTHISAAQPSTHQSKDSLLGRVFPSSEVVSTIDHFPVTVPHSEQSESHNGHSASRRKTPGPTFVPSEIRIRNVEMKRQPQLQAAEKGAPTKPICYIPGEASPVLARSHIRQRADTSITPPHSPMPRDSYVASPSSPATSPVHRSHAGTRAPSDQRQLNSFQPHSTPAIISLPQSVARRPLRTPRVLTIPAPLSPQHQALTSAENGRRRPVQTVNASVWSPYPNIHGSDDRYSSEYNPTSGLFPSQGGRHD